MTKKTLRKAKTLIKSRLSDYKKSQYCIWCGKTNCPIELHRIEDVITVHDAVRKFIKWEKVLAIIKCCIPLCHDCHKYIDGGEP